MKTEHRLAVDVIVDFHGKVLFARRNADPFKGKLEIIGGFVNPGEPVDTAALREVKEETGLGVKIDGVLGVYSFTTNKIRKCSLAVAFVASSDRDDVRVSDEAEELVWVDLDAVKDEDLAYDHSRLIDNYRNWKTSHTTFLYTEPE